MTSDGGEVSAISRDEVFDGRRRPGRDAVGLIDPAQRRGERDALARGQRLDQILGAVTDSAPRDVQDAAQRHGVFGVDEHAQVSEQVANLAAFVEPHPADHLVRQADSDEDLFEDSRLRIGAVEDRDIAVASGAEIVQPVDLLGHEGGFAAFVVGDVAADLLAIARIGPQVLRLAALVARDDRIGRAQDRLG
jgi:hypothetical protein